MIGGALRKERGLSRACRTLSLGRLKDLASDDLFRNVIFADEAGLDHAALRVARAAKEFDEQSTPEEAQLSAVDGSKTLRD